MDATQLSTFIMCPERYRLKFVEGLQRAEEDVVNQPLVFGQAIHAGLEQYYRDVQQFKQQPTYDFRGVEHAFLQVFPTAIDPTEQARTPEHGLRVLREYIPWAAEHDQDWKILAIEEVESFQPTGFIEPWQTKKDLVVETSSGIWVIDHKTTGKAPNDTYWRQFEPNLALTGYVAHTKAKYGQCSGVIVNMLSLGYRQRAYRGDPAGFHWKPERQIFSRTTEQVQDWERNVRLWMTKLEFARINGLWGKNEGACIYCTFRPLCMACGDVQVQESLYVKGNPFDYLEEVANG